MPNHVTNYLNASETGYIEIEGDDKYEKIELFEKRVAVNHAGSVITKEPLDLGKEGYISLTAENEPGFIGETMSLYEFLESGEAENEDMGMEMNT